jgi:hypothetical protein
MLAQRARKIDRVLIKTAGARWVDIASWRDQGGRVRRQRAVGAHLFIPYRDAQRF